MAVLQICPKEWSQAFPCHKGMIICKTVHVILPPDGPDRKNRDPTEKNNV